MDGCGQKILTCGDIADSKKSSINKGVCFDSTDGTWSAEVQRDGMIYHLGNYSTEIEAAIAYKTKVKLLDGEKAILNNLE